MILCHAMDLLMSNMAENDVRKNTNGRSRRDNIRCHAAEINSRIRDCYPLFHKYYPELELYPFTTIFLKFI